MLIVSLLFKEIYELHGQITQEFVGLRKRNFQGIVNEIKHIGRFSNLHQYTFKRKQMKFCISAKVFKIIY